MNLEKINQFTRRELTEEEVYTFDVILCDNDIDRDSESFSEKALEQMKTLFIGKTGILDHNPQSSGQTARIYDTELVRSAEQKTKDGRLLISLKASAYMIRTDSNADFIREIDGGIKKEVSVSCMAGKRFCSVCGAEHCGHIIGKKYGKMLCHTVLDDIQDAYEWSFVAVPAQTGAGVTKYFRGAEMVQDTEQQALLAEIEQQMRAEVLTLCRNQANQAVSKALHSASEKMDLQELFHFRNALLEEQKQICDANVQLADFQQR